MNIEKLTKFLICFVAVFSVCHAETLTTGPVRHFLENEIATGSLFKKHEVLLRAVDLNEDGVTDFFLSTTADYREAGKGGVRAWDVYLSDSSKSHQYGTEYTILHQAVFMSGGADLVRLEEANNRLAVVYLSSAGSAHLSRLTAMYVDENNAIQTLSFGPLEIRDSDGKDEDRAIVRRVTRNQIPFSGKSRYPLEEFLDPEQVATLKEDYDDFLSKHFRVTDPNDITKNLYYREDTKEYVGYRTGGGELVPVEKTETEADTKSSVDETENPQDKVKTETPPEKKPQ